LSHIMNKDLNYWIGYIATILVAILLTPIYFACIAMIRLFVVIVEIIWDSLTFMPKALFEFDKSALKRYWAEELDRINKKFKDD
jgi:hypothetical protein